MHINPFRSLHLILCGVALCALAAPAQAGGRSAKASINAGSCAKPVYPQEALRKGQQGTVQLEFTIGADGVVRQARILATSFHPLLDNAARDALQRCRFKPALEQGKPVATTLAMQYVWTLDEPQQRFASAPAHVRTFLEQARLADAIIDPYQRCLAFPDYPGNAWPAGLGKQYCEVTFGKHITGEEVEQLLARGDMAALDAQFRRDLERHFSKQDFSEVIHSDFYFFREASAAADRVSAAWIAKAPESAYANAARGYYLYAMATAARGGKSGWDTPRESMDRMHEQAGKAVGFLEKALRIEPRLMPAYATLIELSKIAGPRRMGEDVYARGAQIDPACRNLTRRRMEFLQPRWGGSAAAMAAHAAQIAPLVAARPLLALTQVLPMVDQADVLGRRKKYTEVVQVLTPAARIAPYDDLFSELGKHLQYSGGNDWDSLVSLLEAYRYGDGDVAAAEARGRLLLDLAADPSWASASLKRAVALDPAQLRARYVLGRGQLALAEFDQAETQLTAALASPDWKDEAAYLLIVTAASQEQLDKVARLAAAYIAAYPEHPRGYFMQGHARMRAGQEAGARASYATFLRLAKEQDGNGDPEQIALAKRYLAGERGRGLGPAAKAKAGT